MDNQFSLFIGTYYQNEYLPNLGVYAVLPVDATWILPGSKESAGEVNAILAVSDEQWDDMGMEAVDKFLAPWVAYARQYGIEITYDTALMELDGDFHVINFLDD